MFSILIVLVFILAPVIYMLSVSMKYPGEVWTSTPTIIPQRPTLDNYMFVWEKTPVPRFFLNSAIVALLTTLLCTSVAIITAYPITRLKIRGGGTLSGWLLLTQMLPPTLLVIPLYLIILTLNLMNTYGALVLSYTCFALPFSILMLGSYFDGIPQDLEDAAMTDGCSRTGALFRVLIPVSIPGIVAVASFVFISSWAEFVYALTFIRTETMRTLPAGIFYFVGMERIEWGPAMASAVIASLPTILLLTYLQKFLVTGLTAGAIKG